MSDFAQHGPIITLPCLDPTSTDVLQHEILPHLTQKTPVALVLPCIAADAIQPPLSQILNALQGARWVQHILIPINGLSHLEFDRVSRDLLKTHPRLPLTLLHTDSDLPELEPGKGTNVLNALGLLKQNAFQGAVAIHDADNLAFQKENLARLLHPIVDRAFGMEFAKQFYSRFDQQLHGRVSRLFLAPLLNTLSTTLPAELTHFLNAFRYPLAGECALTMRLAEQIRIPSGWGLEIGLLAETHRLLAPDAVCQVGSAHPHLHRHHKNPQHLLQQCRAILDTLASHPSTENQLSNSALSPLKPLFTQAQLRALRASSLVARANGLQHDADSELGLCRLFASTLDEPRQQLPLAGISEERP
jgi:glucosyl-3-phosphoglycerate synthase